jgi:hypothetical protein
LISSDRPAGARRYLRSKVLPSNISAAYSGDGRGFRFDLSNARRDVGGGFAEAFKRFSAAFQLRR